MALQRPCQSYNNNEYLPTKQQQEANGKNKIFSISMFVLIPAEVNLQGRPATSHLLPVRPERGRDRGRGLPQQDLHLQPEARRPEL